MWNTFLNCILAIGNHAGRYELHGSGPECRRDKIPSAHIPKLISLTTIQSYRNRVKRVLTRQIIIQRRQL